jgi:hypothetical protein
MLQGVASLVIIWDAEDMSMSEVNVGVYVEMKRGSRQQYIGRSQVMFGF